MRITGGEEWHGLAIVENANFGNDAFCKIYVVDIAASLLSDENVSFSEFESFRECDFGRFWVLLGQFRVEVVK